MGNMIITYLWYNVTCPSAKQGMSSVSLAFFTCEEFMHNDFLTYAELMHSMLGAKFDDYEIIINKNDGFSF